VEAYGAGNVVTVADEFRADMKFTSAQISELAAASNFPPDNLEKVLRLRELLIEFHKHNALKGKLVFKGGTALNFFYLNLARLSVDIDLNYIGNIDREATLKERPDICKAVEQIAVDGCTVATRNWYRSSIAAWLQVGSSPACSSAYRRTTLPTF
jgi:predicted nucleotidyltransferase component of viral defense system